jgi:hypothetical protein
MKAYCTPTLETMCEGEVKVEKEKFQDIIQKKNTHLTYVHLLPPTIKL